MDNNKFNWVDFYKEFADKLLAFKNDRTSLVELVKESYVFTGINMPKLEDGELLDIDPFTVFGTFNKHMKESNRISFCKFYKEKLDMVSVVPTSFDGIPILNNQNATFYRFKNDKDRSNLDIDYLWNFYSSALEYIQKDNSIEFIKNFDCVIKIKSNGNSKITMGLFWINPDVFINLDKRNQWYIYESGKINLDFVKSLPEIDGKISGFNYLKIIEMLRGYLNSSQTNLKSFLDLSFDAWNYSEEVNMQIKESNVSYFVGDGLADNDVPMVHYWLYSPGTNAFRWDDDLESNTMSIGWGDLGDCSNLTEKEIQKRMNKIYASDKSYKNSKHAIWQFIHEIKVGDVIFVKKGMHGIIGRGVVTSDFRFDEDIDSEYRNIRDVEWTHTGNWIVSNNHPVKSLTDITSKVNDVNRIKSLFEDDLEEDEDETVLTYPKYTSEDFLRDVYMSEGQYNTLVGLLDKKKNVVLQGAPGVGKTFVSKRLAYSIIGEKNPDRVMMVQFHQSYSYEDFIEGYRPCSSGDGFEIKKGTFYNFCKRAEEDLEHKYFFLIDEINRGNLSKIFGELFMLIENDKRGNKLGLLYSDELFAVPCNVYIIGMMNTADRGLAMLDYALRRRFAFYEICPAFNSASFNEYVSSLNNNKLVRLIGVVQDLNDSIVQDDSLGEGFCIGHSYFCGLKDVSDFDLMNIVEFELIPLLKEYWFDEKSKVELWSNLLRSAVR